MELQSKKAWLISHDRQLTPSEEVLSSCLLMGELRDGSHLFVPTGQTMTISSHGHVAYMLPAQGGNHG